jgi:hypothetical protein
MPKAFEVPDTLWRLPCLKIQWRVDKLAAVVKMDREEDAY